MNATNSTLHSCQDEPIFSAMSFLNEVMDAYPEAISFAPGAPDLSQLSETEVTDGLFHYYRAQNGHSKPTLDKLLMGYGPSKGVINDFIARALSHDLQRPVSQEWVITTAGAQEAMLLVFRSLISQPSDRLAVVAPCYPGCTGAARFLGLAPLAVRENAEGLDFGDLDHVLKITNQSGERLRALYVAPDFANPSGTCMPVEHRRLLLEYAQRNDFVLIEDTTYAFTAETRCRMPSLFELDTQHRVIQIHSFSKICWPGLRVGFVLSGHQRTTSDGSTELITDALARLKSMVTINTSPLCQFVAAGMLLKNGLSFVKTAQIRQSLYRGKLSKLSALLEKYLPAERASKIGITWQNPSGGFFICMTLPVRADMALLRKCATKFGVLWTPMDTFYPDGRETRNIRLSCSFLSDTEMEEGVKRLVRFLITLNAVSSEYPHNGR